LHPTQCVDWKESWALSAYWKPRSQGACGLSEAVMTSNVTAKHRVNDNNAFALPKRNRDA
jgi:hypothetical protein